MNRDRQLDLGDQVRVEVIDANLATPLEHAKAICKQRTLDDCYEPFFVADLSTVASQLRCWRSRLPRLEPFYAVKCNDDTAVLRTLAELGAGFACASKPELRRVMQFGVSPDRVIVANPCKFTSLIRSARDSQVSLMAVDSVDELYKVKEQYSEAKLVLRIQPQAGRTRCLGGNFSAPYEFIARLARTAKALELEVVGVSLHIDSRCQDTQLYAQAVRLARRVFDDLATFGYTPYVLDIGGGFAGTDDDAFSIDEIADVLVPALDHCFPTSSGVRLISELGRFLVERAFVLMANVIAKRVSDPSSTCSACSVASDAKDPATSMACCQATNASRFNYYLNDGVYGSFNCALVDRAPQPRVAKRVSITAPHYSSCIYGPTCDELDCIAQDALLPELFVGDWLYFENMGAYTLGQTEFNSETRADRYYVVHKTDATLFGRELAALVAECGRTSDLVALLGEALAESINHAHLDHRKERLEAVCDTSIDANRFEVFSEKEEDASHEETEAEKYERMPTLRNSMSSNDCSDSEGLADETAVTLIFD